MKKIVCFGEVLWDLFPNEKKIGGAPLNVALRLKFWGIDTKIISSVGNDALGAEILSLIKKKGLNTKYIFVNKNFETGTVNVSLNKKDLLRMK